jgi:predicted subunit of tRNA(5-methylaminomethyl-2-thiouridylate) methyltransferase
MVSGEKLDWQLLHGVPWLMRSSTKSLTFVRFRFEELRDLHGMGKSAIARLVTIMDAKKIRFR